MAPELILFRNNLRISSHVPKKRRSEISMFRRFALMLSLKGGREGETATKSGERGSRSVVGGRLLDWAGHYFRIVFGCCFAWGRKSDITIDQTEKRGERRLTCSPAEIVHLSRRLDGWRASPSCCGGRGQSSKKLFSELMVKV